MAGLLALMLLTHARCAARTAPDGSLVPLAEQDRGERDVESILGGVEIRVRDINNDEGNRLLRMVRRSSGSVMTWRRAQMVMPSA